MDVSNRLVRISYVKSPALSIVFQREGEEVDLILNCLKFLTCKKTPKKMLSFPNFKILNRDREGVRPSLHMGSRSVIS